MQTKCIRSKTRTKTNILLSHWKAAPPGRLPAEKVVSRPQLASDLGYYSPRGPAVSSPKVKKLQLRDTAQLATFTSAEVFDTVKKGNQREGHEAMLKRELGKFRAEIELKHKLSQMNRTYQFPRTQQATVPNDPLDPDSDLERFGSISNDITFVVSICKASTHVPEFKTRPSEPPAKRPTLDPKWKLRIGSLLSQPATKPGKRPFLMLSFRRNEESPTEQPRILSTMSRSPVSGLASEFDLKRDLRAYISQKEDKRDSGSVPRLGSFRQLRLPGKQVGSPRGVVLREWVGSPRAGLRLRLRLAPTRPGKPKPPTSPRAKARAHQHLLQAEQRPHVQ